MQEPLRRRRYPTLGVLLALGAPLGHLLLRSVLEGSLSPAWVTSEVGGHLATYVYLTVSTSTVFALLGWRLGKSEDALRATATTDPLTGLANRRSFDARLEVELERARRSRSPLSLLVIDVDGLKKINDLGGHEAGDRALRAVGQALAHSSRRTDLTARTGGDEFAIVAPGTAAGPALELAARLRAVLAERHAAGEPAPTVSLGISDLERAGPAPVTAIALRAAADKALYRAKAEGRDRAVVAPLPGETTHAGTP